MPNKSFVVQYILEAKEKYSKVAGRVASSSGKMAKVMDAAKKSAAALSSGIKTLKNSSLSLVPSLTKINKAGIAAEASMERLRKKYKGLSYMSEKVRNAGLAVSAGITAPFLFAVRSMKNAARDANETRSKFATVFSTISSQSEQSADNLAKNFGLTGTKARQLIGDTGDLLTGFGFTQQGALDLSTKVNELAVDLASFTNFSGGAEGASQALTKALLGERESLKSLGVAISEKDVKAKISKMVAEGHKFASLRQAKAQATLALAVEQSKNAVGDFARTSQDLANQERITGARIQDLKESFGKILLPVALKVTKVIRSIAERMEAMSPQAKKAILIFAGIAAVLGPILLLVGGIGLALPALAAGFAAVGGAITIALGPVGLILAAIAAAALLIIKNWGKLKAFFGGFFSGLRRTAGPTVSKLVDSFVEAAQIISGLFSSDSEASQNFMKFAEIGELIGSIIGEFISVTIRGLSGVGAIIGQLLGAITTLDFTQFDIEAIKAEFTGEQAPIKVETGRVDVGVSVGLEKGLAQTTKPAIAGAGVRRADVGLSTAGL